MTFSDKGTDSKPKDESYYMHVSVDGTVTRRSLQDISAENA